MTTLNLDKSTSINQIVLQEDIRFGERVREFVLQGKVNAEWIEIYRGSSIGQKHIAIFSKVEVESVRLLVIDSKGEPIIRSRQLFKIE